MSLIELQVLINTIQDRMESEQIRSSLFKAGLIVNSRLIKQYQSSVKALKYYQI